MGINGVKIIHACFRHTHTHTHTHSLNFFQVAEEVTESSAFDVSPILEVIATADQRDEIDDESETTIFDVPSILELITPADERDETDDETRPPLMEFWVSRQIGAKWLGKSKFSDLKVSE